MGKPSLGSQTACCETRGGQQLPLLPRRRATVAKTSIWPLTFADENARAGADPAFDAHIMPIGDWATAVWEQWMPERAMERLAAKAKQKLKKAKNPWAKVKGPAAAMVASCRRLGWTVVNSTELRTDQWETLHLNLDSPAAVKLEVARAVKRWR